MRYCSLSSGSKGNSSIFSARNTHILIDAGISCKKLTEGVNTLGIDPYSLSGILITHEHSDHVKGLKNFSQKFHIPIYVNEGTLEALKQYEIDMRLVRIFRPNEDFYIRDLCISATPISHDAAQPVGYTIECGDCRASVFTDLGYASRQVLDMAKESDLVVLEANHDVEMLKNGTYPQYLKKRVLGKKGHLSNDTSAEVAAYLGENGVSNIVLAHISQQNNRPELAQQAVAAKLKEAGLRDGKDILIGLALQDIISPVYELG